MPTNREDTRRSTQGLDNSSFNDTYGIYEHLPYEFDGTNIAAKPSSLVAKKITVSGNFTYVASAPPGTAQATAKWRVKRIEVSGGDTLITWADGNTNFDNAATDLTGLNYS